MKSKLAITSFILSLIPSLLFILHSIHPISIFYNRYLQHFLGIPMDILTIYSMAILPLSGILAIISLVIIPKYKLEGRGFAVAAIIISILSVPLIILKTFGA